MTHRVGPKGQVVIPKTMREELGLRPGDEVVFTLDARAVRVERARAGRPLGGSLRGHDLVGALEASRRDEPR